MLRIALLCVALAGYTYTQTPGRLASTGTCANQKRAFYPAGACDAYIECIDGVAHERLCPDGLLFNADTGPQAYPCQYPIDVDCRARSSVQPAQPTERCPHQFAYYRNGDSQNCGKFVNCAGGVAYDFECPDGLAWNKDTYKCDWPDQVPDCDAEAFLGFTCPNIAKSPEFGDAEIRYYRSNTDCAYYFACVEGRPRRFRCNEEQAFSVETNQCEHVSNVTGCAYASETQYRTEQPKLVTVQYRQQPRPTPAFNAFRGPHSLCLERNGKFPVRDQCDAYVECTDGVPEQKLCPDGMVLTNSTEIDWECALVPPHLVCGDRTKLQPAQPTEDCPHQFGLFHYGDAAHCGQYINCANGEASLTNCSIGLAFNKDTWRCDWPDEVADCDPEAYLQFNCPKQARQLPGNGDQIYYHPWEHDCRYYFACVNNKPRLQTCGYCKCYHDLIDSGVDVADSSLPGNVDAPQVKAFSVDEVLKIQVPKGRF